MANIHAILCQGLAVCRVMPPPLLAGAACKTHILCFHMIQLQGSFQNYWRLFLWLHHCLISLSSSSLLLMKAPANKSPKCRSPLETITITWFSYLSLCLTVHSSAIHMFTIHLFMYQILIGYFVYCRVRGHFESMIITMVS